MILCIAEKPSVARDLAKILGANNRYDGFLEGNNYAVTWTFGHLCCLKDPDDYLPHWKRWDIWDLPIYPPRFGIKLINERGYEKQFETIKMLVGKAEMVINCGDAGQEGELIQRWVLQKAECKVPIKRLWVSSLTNEALKEGFANLRSNDEMETLYFAGLARAIGDWLLGINATRLYTKRYAKPGAPLSVGRVQTPTLSLIVERQREIENFIPSTTFEVQILYREVFFRQTGKAFATEEEAIKVLESLREEPFEITKVTEKKGKEYPPKLFDLTALQVEANKRYKLTADQTLKAIQALYENKLTTYPRVDTVYLSDDIWPKIPHILSGLGAFPEYDTFTAKLREKGALKKSKKVFDNSKVTDHHAIIPTGVKPTTTLSEQQSKVYDLVARRFIAAFYPESQTSTTTVEGKVKDLGFKTSGKRILTKGWREVYTSDEEDRDPIGQELSEDEKDSATSDKERFLPDFKEGESGLHTPNVKKKVSEPPKYYTEATLLRAMETAGKLVEDDLLRDALKQNGIGRPSTRAAIIETLFKRGYVTRERSSLRATELGTHLINAIQEPMLKSVEMTGQWEYKLRCIERGEYDPAQFLSELKEQITVIISDERRRPITQS